MIFLVLTSLKGIQQFQKQRKIKICGKQLSAEAISSLVKEMKIKQVKILHLSNCNLSQGAVTVLAESQWQNLENLNLSENQKIGTEGYKKLAKILHAEKLRSLNLSKNKIVPMSLYMFKNSNWPNLTEVDLRQNKIGDKGCSYFKLLNWNLTLLNLMENDIGDHGIRLLSQCRWPNLRTLDLDKNKIGVTGCKWLSQSQWPHLIFLSINCDPRTLTRISKAGWKWLSKADWKQLTVLNLQSHYLSWEGVRQLTYCDLPKLQKLDIRSYYNEGCLYVVKMNGKITDLHTEFHHIQNRKFYGYHFHVITPEVYEYRPKSYDD